MFIKTMDIIEVQGVEAVQRNVQKDAVFVVIGGPVKPGESRSAINSSLHHMQGR